MTDNRYATYYTKSNVWYFNIVLRNGTKVNGSEPTFDELLETFDRYNIPLEKREAI